MKTTAYRHEIKYCIDALQRTELDARLSALMETDRFASADGTYFIRSLYFDNAEDKALKEKVHGVSRREKFRIRYYNLDPSFIRLEKKSKIKNLTAKESAPLSKEQCEMLLRGEYAFLSEEPHPLLTEFYAKQKLYRLRPAVVVDYTRKTFVHPLADTRITLDYHIRTGIRHRDFLDPALPTVPCDMPEHRPFCILEIKYNEFLPGWIQDAVQLDRCRATPFSKYEISRRFD